MIFGSVFIVVFSMIVFTIVLSFSADKQSQNKKREEMREAWIERENKVFFTLYEDGYKEEYERLIGRKIVEGRPWESRNTVFEVSLYEGDWVPQTIKPRPYEMHQIEKEFTRKTGREPHDKIDWENF